MIDGVPLKEWDFPVDFVARLFVGFLSRDAVRVDDEGTLLAPADMGVKLQSLLFWISIRNENT